RHEVRRRVPVDLTLERVGKLVDAARSLDSLCLPVGELRHLEVGERLRALVRRRLEERVEIYYDRSAVLGLGAQSQRATAGQLDLEAHHDLVDRADLLDVQGSIRQPLAVKNEQP